MKLKLLNLVMIIILLKDYWRTVNAQEFPAIKTIQDSAFNKSDGCLVSVQEFYHHICSGNKILLNFVLVAAHCVCYDDSTFPKTASNLQVIQNKDDSIYTNLLNVKFVYIHPQYAASESLEYDVALLKVTETGPTGKVSAFSLPKFQSSCVAVGLKETEYDLEVIVSTANLMEENKCADAKESTMLACSEGECIEDTGALLLCENSFVGVQTIEACTTENLTIWTLSSTLSDWVDEVSHPGRKHSKENPSGSRRTMEERDEESESEWPYELVPVMGERPGFPIRVMHGQGDQVKKDPLYSARPAYSLVIHRNIIAESAWSNPVITGCVVGLFIIIFLIICIIFVVSLSSALKKQAAAA